MKFHKIIFFMKLIRTYNKTALHIAVKNENSEIVRLLLNHSNIDINNQSINIFFILHHFVFAFILFIL